MKRQERWAEDRLGFAQFSGTFVNLILSLEKSSTISVEAGFGRGKTFFSERWAKDLEDAEQTVIQIDAQASDHSGDPVVTFLGALLRAVPASDPDRWKQGVDAVKRLGLAGAKTVAKAVLREGATELGEYLAGDGQGMPSDVLKDLSGEAGKGLSKLAGQMIETQLAAEAARAELKDNLDALHAAITADTGTDRIVVLIDELDRCHPDYALALLEAMKLVFHHPGFVFVLFVNADYLENLAAHRFGTALDGEPYLDKFVDIRIGLPIEPEELRKAVRQRAENLPLNVPFGAHAGFSVVFAARLAGDLALASGLSMRQIERVLTHVELTMRCYRTEPIDTALLVYLAFEEAVKRASGEHAELEAPPYFQRALLTPQLSEELLDLVQDGSDEGYETMVDDAKRVFEQEAEVFFSVPLSRYVVNHENAHMDWYSFLTCVGHLYVPQHRDMLRSVRRLSVRSGESVPLP